LTYNTALVNSGRVRRGTAAKTATLRSLMEENINAEARQELEKNLAARPDDRELKIQYIDILIKAGELADAERLLEAELQYRPDRFDLLFRLGRIDEIRGQNLSAADLFRRAEAEAKIAADKREVRTAIDRVREKVSSDVIFTPDSFTINLFGNSSPLKLQYKLKQQQKRRALFETLLGEIDPRSKSVLELECDSGLVARNLAAHGLKAEGAAEEMTDIVLAIGFEYVEMLRKPGSLSPSYFRFEAKPDTIKELDKYDQVHLLPGRFQWYRDRGVSTTARLINKLTAKSKRQLFFYIPAVEGKGREEALQFEQMLLEQLMESNLPSPPEKVEMEGGGSLYRVNRRQAAAGDKEKLLPQGLNLNGSRSSVLEVELEKCRSLNGFSFGSNGWNHFTALLEELLANPKLTYEESLLKKFYDRFQPKNRQEQLFGSESEVLSPLDRGWTLLPWVDTKNRSFNPLESPQLNGKGNPHYGPNNIEFGQYVCKRLLAGYTLIREYGYLPEIFPDGYIQGYLLKDGDDYRFYVNEGQHRIAALGLLRYQAIKVKCNPDFLPVVDIKNIRQWPQVRRGLYSEETAAKVFRHYFEEDGSSRARQLGLLK